MVGFRKGQRCTIVYNRGIDMNIEFRVIRYDIQPTYSSTNPPLYLAQIIVNGKGSRGKYLTTGILPFLDTT